MKSPFSHASFAGSVITEDHDAWHHSGVADLGDLIETACTDRDECKQGSGDFGEGAVMQVWAGGVGGLLRGHAPQQLLHL